MEHPGIGGGNVCNHEYWYQTWKTHVLRSVLRCNSITRGATRVSIDLHASVRKHVQVDEPLKRQIEKVDELLCTKLETVALAAHSER